MAGGTGTSTLTEPLWEITPPCISPLTSRRRNPYTERCPELSTRAVTLCRSAANALRDLCDANRAALAPHIGAFAELHAGLNDIPVREISAWSANPLMS